jgi:hypothetical protein
MSICVYVMLQRSVGKADFFKNFFWSNFIFKLTVVNQKTVLKQGVQVKDIYCYSMRSELKLRRKSERCVFRNWKCEFEFLMVLIAFLDLGNCC